ncbi:DUF84 family protein [Patescibacteria group bacterium]|nr:DUF84 family protein [Patescibacteria group bacterium]
MLSLEVPAARQVRGGSYSGNFNLNESWKGNEMEKSVVVVCSKSPLKIRAVDVTFQMLGLGAEIISRDTESGVGIQPIGLDAMETGARNRVQNVEQLRQDPADFYIGIECGLVCRNDNWFVSHCVFARREEKESIAFGSFFPIPVWMKTRAIEQKSCLGRVARELAGGGEKDPERYLSQESILREQIISQAVLCALVPLLHCSRFREH